MQNIILGQLQKIDTPMLAMAFPLATGCQVPSQLSASGVFPDNMHTDCGALNYKAPVVTAFIKENTQIADTE